MNENIDIYLDNAKKARQDFNNYTQKEIDKIIKELYKVSFENSINLAKMAVKETGIGKWEDKVTKNILASKYIYNDIKKLKTVGIVLNNAKKGIIEIAHPIGTILALVPSTNPTSTIIFKILITLKTRNPIIISTPSLAKDVCSYTAKLLYETALKAGAPEHCIQWIANPSREKTHYLMKDKRVSLILATGGNSLVKSAYSSGTPAFGVGSGNVPVVIDSSADINFAIGEIIKSKTFDNGTICASEQAIIVEEEKEQELFKSLDVNHAYILSVEEISKLEDIVYDKVKNRASADIVGKSVEYIAKKANIQIPKDISLLVVKQEFIGENYPFSLEILAPIIALYITKDFNNSIDTASKILENGGKGHTASIFSNTTKNIIKYSKRMNTARVVVNTPSSQGAVGGIYNHLTPSLTLGCGSYGGNITTDNISAKHLLNIQRVAKPISQLESLKEKVIYRIKELTY
ncbi:MAG TPA: aldehyde dehydrogenase family protein [Campylobacterales bacterium]|nr:aldehyde dehydrogenase family protein [Campylobacterales bacterium]